MGGGGGGLIFFFMEETGQVKTELGECNLKVTRPDGECSKILVSNPAIMQNFNEACYQFTSKTRFLSHEIYA